MPGCVAPGCKDAATAGPFCAKHAAAPAGQRGGWLSAYRRALARGHGATLDASSVARRLWIGAAPPFDRDLPDFDVLVLTALEHQPTEPAFHGVVVRCPLVDGPLAPPEITRALTCGKSVAKALADGRRVLVTCHAGRNRSALVAGLGLGLVTRMTADQIVELIRARRRQDALSNPYFVKILKTYVPGPTRAARAAVR